MSYNRGGVPHRLDIQLTPDKWVHLVVEHRELPGLERYLEQALELVRALALERVCVAPDCRRVFSPGPRARKKKYCSHRCRKRINQRKLREKWREREEVRHGQE